MNKKIFLFTALVCLLLCSCGGSKKSDENPNVGMGEMVLAKQDTTQVIELVDAFMGHLKNGDYDIAADMLYESTERDSEGMPVHLSDVNRGAMIEMFRQWPVTDYNIKEITFKELDDNEIKCGVEISNSFEIKWSFKPVRYGSDWLLTMRDSLDGDRDIHE